MSEITSEIKNTYSFNDLLSIMHRLRKECPWDQEQTMKSLRSYLVEETYEVLDALDRNDPIDHPDELGDLLLQIVFQAEIASERTDETRFDVSHVTTAICQKMVRRHPHVFGESQADTSDAVLSQWAEIKAQENNKKGKSTFSGIPPALPALARAQKIGEKVARVGFDWPTLAGPLAKMQEELSELEVACEQGRPEHIAEELGDVLFSAVNLCRKLKVDAETALSDSCNKFTNRWEIVEDLATAKGANLKDLDLDAQEKLWDEAKVLLSTKS
jgi:tetrapyrrole methylase family protein/MazG family protein